MARVAPLLGFLGLWYAFNAAFNVQNKVILNKFRTRGRRRGSSSRRHFVLRAGLAYP